MSIEAVHEALASDGIKNILKAKARQLRHRFGPQGPEPKEIQQELTLHVLRKAHLFDPKRGPAGAFITVVVDTATAIMCRFRNRLKRGSGLQLLSLEGSVQMNKGEKIHLSDQLVEDDRRRHRGELGVPYYQRHQDERIDLTNVLERLTPPLRQVAQLLMNDGTEASVARDLMVSRRQIRKAIDKLRVHLRQSGFSEI